jgi:organic hydroperoxide reductase OsmC/OhrA
MTQEPAFEGTLSWAGQPQDLPFDYDHYNRATTLEFAGGARIEASSPSVFKGDDTRANPETLMLGSLMQCHFLTLMAVAAKARMPVAGYSDRASGRLGMKDGKMRYVEVVLRPKVRFADPAHAEKLAWLHEKAHANCFMSNSVNFPVRLEPDLD